MSENEGEEIAIDVEFVSRCIDEFQAVDSTGEYFRYPIERIEVNHSQIRKYPLGISFESMLPVMQHVFSVLQWIDDYLLNKHAENEEWEEIESSF